MEKYQENQPNSIMEDDQDSDGAETVAPSYVPANKPLWVKIKFPNMKKSMEEEVMKDGPKGISNKEVLIRAHEGHSDREWRGMEPPDEAAINFFEPKFGAMNRRRASTPRGGTAARAGSIEIYKAVG
ncbi:Hypothetical predicted protein [Olea europaea subsp. europaea]|uniref:Uncharacterized protein n=1 Tax=Olea europaea subsp. europaea TaxID=158383 RepID=A0A8S0SXI1_OLEEU|nr:Hypothetical predicted protein [Olea europaea subsp. europaea]